MSTRALESLVKASACGKEAGNEDCAHCDALAELAALRKAATVFAGYMAGKYPDKATFDRTVRLMESIAKEAP